MVPAGPAPVAALRLRRTAELARRAPTPDVRRLGPAGPRTAPGTGPGAGASPRPWRRSDPALKRAEGGGRAPGQARPPLSSPVAGAPTLWPAVDAAGVVHLAYTEARKGREPALFACCPDGRKLGELERAERRRF